MNNRVSVSMPILGAEKELNDAKSKEQIKSKEALSRMMRETFKKPIVGDVFNLHHEKLEGMIYSSRIHEDVHKKPQGGDTSTEENKRETNNKALSSSLGSMDMFEQDSDSEPEEMTSMNPRQQLATTIRNWSTQAENDKYIIHEGAVHALIALAVMDDAHIKKCCAAALYNLSTRPENRAALLNLNAATGVITISMQVKSWKIAKTCAQTLAFLSMHEGSEAAMAKEGAILGSVILLGLKGNRLLPICTRALYNLTCTNNHYKGMERIVKAFLSLPPLPAGAAHLNAAFDTTLLLLKSLRNSARFSWIRPRLVEDGIITALITVASGLHHAHSHALSSARTQTEVVALITENLRLLSDSQSVRAEMVQKGSLEILQLCLPHCDDLARLNIIKTVHNFQIPPKDGQPPLTLDASFEQAVAIVVSICESSNHATVLEYVSACLANFAADNMRGALASVEACIDVMPGLLQRPEHLTQFYTVSACGYLLFTQADTDRNKLEMLVCTFVEAGSLVNDPDAIVCLIVALARISQHPFSLAVLEKHNLLGIVLELLLTTVAVHGENPVVQETCAVAMCRIAIPVYTSRPENLTPEKLGQIADVLFSLLDSRDMRILSNTIAAIQALGDRNLCRNELLARPTLPRIAHIIDTYGSQDIGLSRVSCAVLAAFSYDVVAHAALTDPFVLEVLFSTIKSDDAATREMVATTICNMSIDINACRQMIDKGVIEVLAALSGATSEVIQELCAKCFCNLACAVDMHHVMIQNKVLQTILMIALVRSVSPKTKHLCARALLNFTTDENVPALKEAGATRVFAAISGYPAVPIQYICAQGFLLFSATSERRDDLVTRRPVLQALFSMVRSTNARPRILAGMTICNILSCSHSQRAAIHGGALSVFKLVATQDFEELREAAARTIINLGQSPAIAHSLLQCPLVQILVLIMQTGKAFTFECAVNAISCLSRNPVLHSRMIDEGAVIGLVESILSGRVVTAQCACEVIRCLYMLSYNTERMEVMVTKHHILLAIHMLYKTSLMTAESASMTALLIRNASGCKAALPYIINEGAFLLLRAIVHSSTYCNVAVYRSVIIAILNLSKEKNLHEQIVEQGCMALLLTVSIGVPDADFPAALINEALTESGRQAPEEHLSLTFLDVLRITAAIRHLSETPTCREMLAMGKVVHIFRSFMDNNQLDEDSRREIAHAMQAIAGSKACEAILVSHKSSELLLGICKASSHMDIQTACSMALGQISELTKVEEGTVASLLMLTLEKEAVENAEADDIASALRSGILAHGIRSAHEPTAVAQSSKATTPGAREAGSHAKSLRRMIKDGIASGKVTMALQSMPEQVAEPVKVATDGASDSSGSHLLEDGIKSMQKVVLKEARAAAVVEQSTISEERAAPKLGFTSKKASLKGFLGGSTKIKEVVQRLTAFDMTSKESIQREPESFIANYEKYSYKTFQIGSTVESGGVATRMDIDQELPSVSVEKRVMQGRDRSNELTKLAASMESLPKDTQIITSFPAVVDPKNISETLPQIEEEGGGAYSADSTHTNNNRSATVEFEGARATSPSKSAPKKKKETLSFAAQRKKSVLMQKEMMQQMGLAAVDPAEPSNAAASPVPAAADEDQSPAKHRAGGTKTTPTSRSRPKERLTVPGAAWSGMSLGGSPRNSSSSPANSPGAASSRKTARK